MMDKPVTSSATPVVLPRYDAKDLIQDGDQAEIILGDQLYRLRITKAGKLILTK
jgi:hemin uptake protein HemP